jgi:hypothetical protein
MTLVYAIRYWQRLDRDTYCVSEKLVAAIFAAVNSKEPLCGLAMRGLWLPQIKPRS